MTKMNPTNARLKREYFVYLREARRMSEPSIDAAAKALARFEAYTDGKDFKQFHRQQAVAFKADLARQVNAATGQPLSKATLYATLAALRSFFHWAAGRPGYKSRFGYSDAEYFNLSEKETRIAKARRDRPVPSLEQIHHAIALMPSATEIERRDRAALALTLLTGARDGALISLKLKHIDMIAGRIDQDAREVKTKFSKTFVTHFFPVGKTVRVIVAEWVRFLREDKLWGLDDPLIPATRIELGPEQKFQVVGLERERWRTAAPLRQIFKAAFARAGLPYFNPHSFRKTLVSLGEKMCRTPEEFKAWSQNLGHDGVMTTFVSYGQVGAGRQGDILAALGRPSPAMAEEGVLSQIKLLLESHLQTAPVPLRE